MFIRKHCSVTPYMNYKTGFYANLADVTGNFVCWGEILTHKHDCIEKKGQTRFVQMTESDKECTSLARALCKKIGKVIVRWFGVWQTGRPRGIDLWDR